MSEADKMNTNGPKLNAAASEFIPGQYSKPAPTNSAGKAPNSNNNKPSSTMGGANRGGGYAGNRNRNQNYAPGGMPMQPFYPQAPTGYVDPQQMYMMQFAAQQGLYYDPNSGMLFDAAGNAFVMAMMGPGGVPVVSSVGPGMPMMPQFVPGMMPPTELALNPDGTPVVHEGLQQEQGAIPAEAEQGAEGAAESTATATAESAPMSEPTAVSEQAAPAPAASTGNKYVPPRGADVPSAAPTADPAPVAVPAAAPVPEASVAAATEKLAGLSIDTETEPVDIELPTPGSILRYPKNTILALYCGAGSVIPPELKDYYKAADYAQGSVDGSAFCRAPLGSIVGVFSLSTPGSRGKGSQGNLRHSQSGNNLERSVSTSSFGGGRGSRKGNRGEDRDREPGEIVEGDDGFVAYEGGDEPTPRERSNRRKGGQQLPPAVYKSRFALDASDPMAIVRKANLILNKMSVTNFDKMKDEFLTLLQADAVTEESLQRAVEALVAKAQMEENFCFVYADLCRYLIDNWTALEPEDSTFTSAADKADEEGAGEGEAAEGSSKKDKERLPMGRIFKDRLLSRCQTEFEFDHVSALREIRENPDLHDDERTEKEVLLKKRITGHMRFIGELYMQDLISAGVIKSECLEKLLNSTVEEELVCLCKLFQTVGAKLEKYHLDKSRQKKYKSQNMQDVVPSYFERIKEIGTTHPSSRVRFLMRDLIDMRNNGWVARREEDKMVNLDKKNSTEFTPVETPFGAGSGDARRMDSFGAPPVDEWSVVNTAKRRGPGASSGAPSPVPGGSLSRTSSSAQFSRSNSTSNTNLSGMDRRGPRGQQAGPGPSSTAAPGGVAGGFKKDKAAGGRGPQAAGRLPRTNSARAGSDSPVPTADGEGDGAEAEATSTPVEFHYGHDLAAIQKKVRSAMKEFYGNGLIEEPKLSFQELKPAPSIIIDVVKDMISQAVETSSEKSCVALCDLLAALPGLTVPGLPAPLLSPEFVKEAVYKFLNNFDDVLIDAPKAGTLGAVIVANLVHKDLLKVELFATLPEDNEFAFSSKFVEFVVLVLAALNNLQGAEETEKQYKEAELNLLDKVNAPPKESPEDVLRAMGAKFGVTYLV